MFEKPLLIVGDAAIAAESVVQGRLVPLLIIDTNKRPEISELIRIHENQLPGSASTQWASRMDNGNVLLCFVFSEPMALEFKIEFELPGQAILVQQTMISKCLYVQTGVRGDRLANTLDHPRILVEVPDTGFEKVWPKMYSDLLAKDFQQRGLIKRDAAEVTGPHIQKWNDFGGLRIPQWYEDDTGYK